LGVSNTATNKSSGCYVDVLMCNQSWSGGLGTEHVAGPNCKAAKYLYVKRVKVMCDDEIGSTGGTTSQDGTLNNGSFDNSGGSTTPDSMPNNNTTSTIEIITSPVQPYLDIPLPSATPCQELSKISNNTQLKDSLIHLGTKTGESIEYGYQLTRNTGSSVYNPPTPTDPNPNSNETNSKIGGNRIGAFHTHPDAASEDVYPMFSDADINYLYWVAFAHDNGDNPKNYAEYILTLTVPQGTFALKIKDWAKFSDFRNDEQLWKNYDNGKEGIIKRLRKSYDKISPTDDINIMKNILLTLLQNSGVGLYEASADLSSWSELELQNPTGNIDATPPKKTNCN